MKPARGLREDQSDLYARTRQIEEILKKSFPRQKFKVSPILTTSKRFPFPIDKSPYPYTWIERIVENGGFIEVFWVDGVSQQNVARVLSKEGPLIDFHRDVSPQNWSRVAEEIWTRFPEGTFQSKKDLTFQIFVDHEIWKTEFP